MTYMMERWGQLSSQLAPPNYTLKDLGDVHDPDVPQDPPLSAEQCAKEAKPVAADIQSAFQGHGGFGAPNFSNSYANNFRAPGGTSLSNTAASSRQPGSFGGSFGFGGAPHGFGGAPFGFGGAPHGFGGLEGQASGAAHGKITEGQSFGPQGFTQITTTGSGARVSRDLVLIPGGEF